MKLYGIWPFMSGFFHIIYCFESWLCYSRYQSFIPFYEHYSIVWMDHIFSSSAVVQLGCFHLWLLGPCCCEHVRTYLFISLVTHRGVESLGPVAFCVYHFEEPLNRLLKQLHHFTFLSAVYEASNSFTSSPALINVWFQPSQSVWNALIV